MEELDLLMNARTRMTLQQDPSLSQLQFKDKWPLLINSVGFMVAGMLMLIVSWRQKRNEKITESSFYYVFLKKDHGASTRSRSGSSPMNRSHLYPSFQHRDGLHFKTLFFDFLSITCLCTTILM